jgi:outer membrane protein OmpA-like peptidoglycan-associated protein
MFRDSVAVFSMIFSLCVGATAQPASSVSEPSRGWESLADKGSESFGNKLQIKIDRTKVDLERHRLEISMNKPASRVELRVLGDDDELLAEQTFHPKTSGPDEPISLEWSQPEKATVVRIEIKGFDNEDNWVGVQIVPWSVSIPHQEVNFETDQATVRSSEYPKLQESLSRISAAIQRYQQLGKIQLFIAGHTDTVGAPNYNLQLSRRRAQAIAHWFVKNGMTIPVAFEGFGETALLVETKDEVDEARNRRVDYILSIETPVNRRGRAPAWKYLNR